jgi:hypothetical protein
LRHDDDLGRCLSRCGRGHAADELLAHDAGYRPLADDSLLRDRILLDHAGLRHALDGVDAAAADDRAATGTCAEFRQGHANRHDVPLFLLLALAPHGTVSSFCALNDQETQNKLLSASVPRAVYPVLGRFFTGTTQSLWLMYGFGTVCRGTGAILVNRDG